MSGILISHRGNLDGKNPSLENSPAYIWTAISEGYDVEIDVWYQEGNFYLGHDEPTYPITMGFLENEKLWCHAKNVYAFDMMLRNKNIHCFWHENDKRTLTSRGYVWTYTGEELIINSIAVLPENFNQSFPSNMAGICSDYIKNY